MWTKVRWSSTNENWVRAKYSGFTVIITSEKKPMHKCSVDIQSGGRGEGEGRGRRSVAELLVFFFKNVPKVCENRVSYKGRSYKQVMIPHPSVKRVLLQWKIEVIPTKHFNLKEASLTSTWRHGRGWSSHCLPSCHDDRPGNRQGWWNSWPSRRWDYRSTKRQTLSVLLSC